MSQYRIYCGSAIAKDVAHRLSLWDIHIITAGKEYVHVETKLDKDTILSILGRQGGWSTRDIRRIKES